MNKRILLALVGLLLTVYAGGQSCLNGGTVFNMQSQIDSFSINYPDCQEIEGTVIITGSNADDPINNLMGLSQLTKIDGDLVIDPGYELQDLAGLENLFTIVGNFVIEGTDLGPGISHLSGLDTLALIWGNLLIENNQDLLSLSGLESLKAVGNIMILNSNSLSDLSGLEGLLEVWSNLIIANNSGLNTLNGLDSLYEVGNIEISNNENLQSISGLPQLLEVRQDLIINENFSLEILDGFSALDTIGGDLEVDSNIVLLDISGFNLLRGAKVLIIQDNFLLEDISGLTSLNNIELWFRIINNSSLVSITGLGNLSTIGSSLVIENNDVLIDLSGFLALTRIPDACSINENASLENLSGFNNLQYIGALLELEHNTSLSSLSGLESLDTIGVDFRIIQSHLQDMQGLGTLDYIGGNFVLIENQELKNLTGLEELDVVEGAMWLTQNDSLTSFIGVEQLDSIKGSLYLNDNDSIFNLTGLNNLKYVGEELKIKDNNLIDNILDLESLQYVGEQIEISSNPLLETCNVPFLCDYILNGGIPIIEENAGGCNSINELILECVPVSILEGRVIADLGFDCEEGQEDLSLSDVLVKAYNADLTLVTNTNDSGYYWLPLLAGSWDVEVVSPSGFWNSCFLDSMITVEAMEDTILTDFILTTEGTCPFLEWDLTLPVIRICDTASYSISYCNYGSETAEDILISMDLDSTLTFLNASVPFTVNSEEVIIFELDSLPVFECGQISFHASSDCDSLEINDVVCVAVDVMPNEMCSPDSLWDEATIYATGFCENDSVFFELENIGEGNIFSPGQYRIEIVIDDIVMLRDVDDYQLDATQKLMLSYAMEGDGMRLSTFQTPGHPSGEEVSVVVPNCNDAENNVILMQLPSNDGAPYEEVFCSVVVGSFDPNIKSAQPSGLGDMHEINKDWNLNYTIEFQNTGNDTAFLVVIRDTLSDNLDLSTLQVRGASHPFSWELTADRELVFAFENILLPDSTTNESASHGLVAFSIDPQVDLLPGNTIENRVGIYFDFNDPVITNTVFHTIRKPVVASNEHMEWCAGEVFDGVEIWQDTSIQILVEFLEYDSVHFVHLDVIPFIENSIDVDVEIGTYLENVLITGDTLFTTIYTAQNTCDSLVTYNVMGLTDVNDIADEFKTVEIFPNPVDEFLLVLDHQNNRNQQWKLVSNLGIVIWRKELEAYESLSKIAMKIFPSGVYFLYVKTDMGTGVWKVIKS